MALVIKTNKNTGEKALIDTATGKIVKRKKTDNTPSQQQYGYAKDTAGSLANTATSRDVSGVATPSELEEKRRIDIQNVREKGVLKTPLEIGGAIAAAVAVPGAQASPVGRAATSGAGGALGTIVSNTLEEVKRMQLGMEPKHGYGDSTFDAVISAAKGNFMDSRKTAAFFAGTEFVLPLMGVGLKASKTGVKTVASKGKKVIDIAASKIDDLFPNFSALLKTSGTTVKETLATVKKGAADVLMDNFGGAITRAKQGIDFVTKTIVPKIQEGSRQLFTSYGDDALSPNAVKNTSKYVDDYVDDFYSATTEKSVKQQSKDSLKRLNSKGVDIGIDPTDPKIARTVTDDIGSLLGDERQALRESYKSVRNLVDDAVEVVDRKTLYKEVNDIAREFGLVEKSGKVKDIFRGIPEFQPIINILDNLDVAGNASKLKGMPSNFGELTPELAKIISQKTGVSASSKVNLGELMDMYTSLDTLLSSQAFKDALAGVRSSKADALGMQISKVYQNYINKFSPDELKALNARWGTMSDIYDPMQKMFKVGAKKEFDRATNASLIMKMDDWTNQQVQALGGLFKKVKKGGAKVADQLETYFDLLKAHPFRAATTSPNFWIPKATQLAETAVSPEDAALSKLIASYEGAVSPSYRVLDESKLFNAGTLFMEEAANRTGLGRIGALFVRGIGAVTSAATSGAKSTAKKAMSGASKGIDILSGILQARPTSIMTGGALSGANRQ